MSHDAIQEVKNWLAENPMMDSDDLMEYVQYASRLVTLGHNEGIQQVPALFKRPQFDGHVIEILKTRCEQGIWEVEEYTGDELALALIDAQDFYCFEQRLGGAMFPDLRPWFADWWEACELADLDEDAASMLQEFLRVYPIPPDDCLPVIANPITENQYALLDAAYRNVKLPVINAFWQETTNPFQANITTGTGGMYSPELFTTLAEEKPNQALRNYMNTQQSVGTITIRRQLTDDWKLLFFIDNEIAGSLPVLRVRIKDRPAFKRADEPTCWFFDLKPLDQMMRSRLLLDEPLHIYTYAGIILLSQKNSAIVASARPVASARDVASWLSQSQIFFHSTIRGLVAPIDSDEKRNPFEAFLKDFLEGRPDAEDEFEGLRNAVSEYHHKGDIEFLEYIIEVHLARSGYYYKEENSNPEFAVRHLQVAIEITESIPDENKRRERGVEVHRFAVNYYRQMNNHELVEKHYLAAIDIAKQCDEQKARKLECLLKEYLEQHSE